MNISLAAGCYFDWSTQKHFITCPWSRWQWHSEVKWSWFCILRSSPLAAAACELPVSDLFLFKFLSRARKVLRFCGNINSVLLHITCHPGGLWLISTYFSFHSHSSNEVSCHIHNSNSGWRDFYVMPYLTCYVNHTLGKWNNLNCLLELLVGEIASLVL